MLLPVVVVTVNVVLENVVRVVVPVVPVVVTDVPLLALVVLLPVLVCTEEVVTVVAEVKVTDSDVIVVLLVLVWEVQNPQVLSHIPALRPGQSGQNRVAHGSSQPPAVESHVSWHSAVGFRSTELHWLKVVSVVVVVALVVIDVPVVPVEVAELEVRVTSVIEVVEVSVVVAVVVTLPAQMAQVVSQVCAEGHDGQKRVSQMSGDTAASCAQVLMQSPYLKHVVEDAVVVLDSVVVETEDSLVVEEVSVLVIVEPVDALVVVVAVVLVRLVVVDVTVSVVVLEVPEAVTELIEDVVELVFVTVVQKPHCLSQCPAKWLLHVGQKIVLHKCASQASSCRQAC